MRTYLSSGVLYWGDSTPERYGSRKDYGSSNSRVDVFLYLSVCVYFYRSPQNRHLGGIQAKEYETNLLAE